MNDLLARWGYPVARIDAWLEREETAAAYEQRGWVRDATLTLEAFMIGGMACLICSVSSVRWGRH